MSTNRARGGGRLAAWLTIGWILTGIPGIGIGQQLLEPAREADLILKLESVFEIPADAREPWIIRNFVIPASEIGEVRHIEWLRFSPGADVAADVARQAVVRMDSTGASRKLDNADDPPGFPGRPELEALSQPDGLFAVWTPGQPVAAVPEGTGWRLHPQADLVVTVDLFPNGSAQSIQPTIELWFAERPPVKQLLTIRLANEAIALPPGEKVTLPDQFTIPTPAWVYGVYPIGGSFITEIRLDQTLPDVVEIGEGVRTVDVGQRLLSIRNWMPGSPVQRFYPVEARRVQAGVKLSAKFMCLNTSDRFVRGGPDPEDEVAELYVQIVVDREQLANQVAQAASEHQLLIGIEAAQQVLKFDPDRADAHARLALLYADFGEPDEAVSHGRKAVSLAVESSTAHGALGAAYIAKNFHFSAEEHLVTAVALDRFNALAWFNLGNVRLNHQAVDKARVDFENAVELEPRNVRFLNNLGTVLLTRHDYAGARELFERVLLINPRHARATANLGIVHEMTANPLEAIELYERALSLSPAMEPHLGPKLEKLNGKR